MKENILNSRFQTLGNRKRRIMILEKKKINIVSPIIAPAYCVEKISRSTRRRRKPKQISDLTELIVKVWSSER